LSTEAFERTYSEELEFMRERDLRSGWMDNLTPGQLSDDIAWKNLGIEVDEMVKGTTDPMVVAEKMGWKPDNVSHQDWARFTKNMTMKEVEKASRKLTLRIID